MIYKRGLVPTAPGEVGHHAGKLLPPEGMRWETDEEFRNRILGDRGDFNEANGRFQRDGDECAWCPWLGAALVLLTVAALLWVGT